MHRAPSSIPRGPILLRDLDLLEPPSSALEDGKVATARRTIRRSISPSRASIRAAWSWCTSATRAPSRADRPVDDIMHELRMLGVEAVAAQDGKEAARHAQRIGLI